MTMKAKGAFSQLKKTAKSATEALAEKYPTANKVTDVVKIAGTQLKDRAKEVADKVLDDGRVEEVTARVVVASSKTSLHLIAKKIAVVLTVIVCIIAVLAVVIGVNIAVTVVLSALVISIIWLVSRHIVNKASNIIGDEVSSIFSKISAILKNK